MKAPIEFHFAQVKRIVRYIGTINFGQHIPFHSDFNLKCVLRCIVQLLEDQLLATAHMWEKIAFLGHLRKPYTETEYRAMAVATTELTWLTYRRISAFLNWMYQFFIATMLVLFISRYIYSSVLEPSMGKLITTMFESNLLCINWRHNMFQRLINLVTFLGSPYFFTLFSIFCTSRHHHDVQAVGGVKSKDWGVHYNFTHSVCIVA